MDKIRLFIFDMDGLMFETGRLAYRAYLESARDYDYEMVHGVYYYLTGRTEDKIIAGMKELYGEDKNTAAWRKTINIHRQEILDREKRVYKKPGLVDLLQFAKEQGVATAVASSSPLDRVSDYLKLENIDGYIDYIVAGDEVTSGKPDPEIFETACKKAGIPKSEAMVFEDSIVGITASKRAEIRSSLIKDDITDLPIYNGSQKLLKKIEDFPIQKETPTYSFSSLLEAKIFLQAQNLTLE